MSYVAHRWDAHRNGAQPTADALAIDGKTRRGPRHESADDVGGLVEPEVMQAHGSQARRIHLMADEDEIVRMSPSRERSAPSRVSTRIFPLCIAAAASVGVKRRSRA